MLTLIEVQGSAGILNLPIQDPSLGYDVQGVEGLDPVKATLVSSSFAQQDGAQYQSSRRETRNIKLSLGLYPDYSIDDVRSLRRRLLPFFMPKKPVKLTFYMSDGLEVDIEGRVESFDSPMFTDEPSAEVSIVCFDPDFVEATPVIVNGMTTAGSSGQSINYSGTVETGIEFQLNVNRSLSSFAIYHQTPEGAFKTTDFQAPLLSGDILKINTLPGQKAVTRTRGSTDSSLLYAVSPQSNWVELETGANNIRVYAEGAAIPYTITYTRRHGGL